MIRAVAIAIVRSRRTFIVNEVLRIRGNGLSVEWPLLPGSSISIGIDSVFFSCNSHKLFPSSGIFFQLLSSPNRNHP